MVAQLFNSTIESNIGFGAVGDFTHEQVVEACRLANAHDFIMGFDDGYQTKVAWSMGTACELIVFSFCRSAKGG
jgi:ABC-type multidrug transport system fused ATPase/permease subunit